MLLWVKPESIATVGQSNYTLLSPSRSLLHGTSAMQEDKHQAAGKRKLLIFVKKWVSCANIHERM